MSNLLKKGVLVIAGCMVMAILLQCFVCSIASAQLNENCTVSVLNRTVNVDSGGNWQLNNVPSNMGQVRVRVTCAEDGKTVSGQSEYVTIQTNGNIPVEEIFFNNDYEEVPTTLTINSEKSVLGTAGETTRLTVWATYSDGSFLDVTSSGQGTAYTVSNPSIGTVSANGLVAAITSGNLIVSVSNEVVLSSISISVQLSGDSDGDGLPDDFELSNGLNPNNPIDALEDMDTDGLTNLEEFNLGTGVNNADTDGDGIEDGEEVVAGGDGFITNPLSGDSDGDGIWDGLEVSSGTDPNDSGSFDLAATLNYIEVTPSNLSMIFNTIMSESTGQLTVIGVLIDGNTIDLTSTGMGTNYTSSDLVVANFGSTDGLVYAGTDGTATITVTNNGFSDTATVSVETFLPIALSYVQLPSTAYANNIDIAGSYAYVAGGAGGLFVVDVSNPDSPFIMTSLDTPGTSIDVKISGNNAYIADGSSGMRIIDISAPSVPVELGFVNTPGIAQDLVKRNNLVFVADGTSGLQIIDATNPDSPTILGFVNTPGTANGVDVEGNIAVIADGNTVQIVDITNTTNPTILGGISVTGDILDLVVSGDYAYIATYSGGFQVVDFSTPTNPSIAFSAPGDIRPTDVALSDQFALFAEQLFPNGAVGIYNVAEPANSIYTAIMDLSPVGGFKGSGIALTQEYVYVTSDVNSSSSKYGSTGNTRLCVGRYRKLQDLGTVVPSVNITSPLDGDVVMEGSIIHMSANATDDIHVVAVNFIVDEVVVYTDTASPYQFDYSVPMSITGLTVSATATDLANNIGIAENAVVNVIPDPLTALIGTVVDTDGNPIAGVTISTINNLSTTTAADGTFSILDVQTALGDVPVTVLVDINGTLYKSSMFSVTPVPGGTTDVEEIVERNTVMITEDTTLTTDNHDLQSKDVTVDGATLTVEGAHTFNSMSVIKNAKLTHPNTTTTEEYLLDLTINNTLTIDTDSAIDVSGKGYLGGYSGSNNSDYGRTQGNTTTGGSVTASGGSYGGLGGQYDWVGTIHNRNGVYGSFYDPNELGSGGGGSTSPGNGGNGGDGGGLVRIKASEIVLKNYGSIKSNGGNGGYSPSSWWVGGGSGGGIYIDVVTMSGDGTGAIEAVGGNYSSLTGAASGGGGGRIAIYYNDISAFDIAKISAYGGAQPNFKGGAGTIYLKSSSQTYGDLVIDNNNIIAKSMPLRAVGKGMITSVLSTVLTDVDANFPVPDQSTGALGLIGLELDPNINDNDPATFTIIDNTATTITIDSADGDMTMVAGIGDEYIGVYTFDDLSLKREASLSTDDNIVVMGVIEISEGGELAANKVDLSQTTDEIFGDVVITSAGPLYSDAVAVDLVDDVLTLIGPLSSNIGTLTLDNSNISTTGINADTVVLSNNSAIDHPNATTTEEYSLDLTITNTLTIDSGSSIDVSGKGYLGGNSGGNNSDYGRTQGNTTTGGSYYASGGSYGGLGGQYQSQHNVNGVYGNVYNPNELGSGGGGSTTHGNGGDGGNGGGLVRITAAEIVLNSSGSIKSDGGDGGNASSSWWDGGGSGGGIYIDVGIMRSDDLTGVVTANGGTESVTLGGASGGGGGRIAIYYDDISGFDTAKISAYGGTREGGKGGAGTVYLKSSTQTYGDLIVDNNGIVTNAFSTPLVSVGTGISTDLTADTLADSTRSWREDELTGIYLNPNTNQSTTPNVVFEILSNGADSITVDNSINNLTDIASIGDTYIGEHYIDNLSVINGARVETLDRVNFNSLDITGGELQADGFYQIGKADLKFDTRYSLFDADNILRMKDGNGTIDEGRVKREDGRGVRGEGGWKRGDGRVRRDDGREVRGEGRVTKDEAADSALDTAKVDLNAEEVSG